MLSFSHTSQLTDTRVPLTLFGLFSRVSPSPSAQRTNLARQSYFRLTPTRGVLPFA